MTPLTTLGSIPVKIPTIMLLLILSMGCNEKTRLHIKADIGNAKAMREYGIWLCSKGHDQEFTEGTAWITKAAERGDVEAMYELGLLKEVGGGPRPEAVGWFRKGAEAGHRFCMIKLANAYRYGELGVTPDLDEAKTWFERAHEAKKPGEM